MADDWTLEKAREIRQWMERHFAICWSPSDFVRVDAEIAEHIGEQIAELRKERERAEALLDEAKESSAIAGQWMTKAAALEAALRETRDDLAVTIAPPIKRQDTAIDRIDTALRDHGGAPAEHDAVCSDPSAPVVKCVVCGKEIHTCERAIPCHGWDYRCPVHPEGVELDRGRWVCSEECELDRDKQIIEALKATIRETYEHLEIMARLLRDGTREGVKL